MATLARSLRPLTSAVSTARRALLSASSSSSRAFSARSALGPLPARRATALRTGVARNSSVPAGTSARFSSALAASRPSEGEARARLVELLEKEVEHEVGASNEADVADEKDLKTFLNGSGWKLKNTVGNDEVVLGKDFGGEKVSVTFSLSEMNRQEDDFSEDADQEHEADIDEDEAERSLSVNAIVNCEKPNHGVLTFDVSFEDGDVLIQNASYYPTADIAKLEDVESDWKRRGLYSGPEFSELEDDLQDAFREYLAERGIDEDLSHFILKYVPFGEQKEYLNWLQRVADHVKA